MDIVVVDPDLHQSFQQPPHVWSIFSKLLRFLCFDTVQIEVPRHFPEANLDEIQLNLYDNIVCIAKCVTPFKQFDRNV